MSWLVLGALMIVYPLFGLGIYLIRTRIAKTRNFSYLIILPVGISFFLGICMLAYSVAIM